MKVLLSAYSCLPGTASLAEPAIGWNWARCIAASGHEVVVLTRAINRPRIEEHPNSGDTQQLRFVYHDLPRRWQALYRIPFGNYAYYYLWQRAAAELACGLHRVERFDRVQHVTWGSFRVPSFMGRLGVPFIFGPVGGGEDTPRNLRKGLGWKGRWWDALRRLSSAMTSPWMAPTYKSATQIIATTRETCDAIPAKYRHKACCRQAVGIDAESVASLCGRSSAARQSSRLELLFVGRLLPWKGVHLIVKALAGLGASESEVHLTVIGAGGDLHRLQQLAKRLKVDPAITWAGWMPREAVIEAYSQFDLFTFPSLHDSGGMAVLEAMSFGLPVVCLDLGGPAMAVNDGCGRVIATRNRSEEQIGAAIAAFLREMMANRAALNALSAGARARAASLTWQANADAVYWEPLLTQVHPLEGAFCAEA